MTANVEATSPHTMNTYGRLPIALSHGRGVRVWDVQGREYLDALRSEEHTSELQSH